MRIKVDVEQVQIGMYVAALDRPWLDSPFLFQGFIVETEEELAMLREHCNYVFIDDIQSRDTEALRQLKEQASATLVVEKPRSTGADPASDTFRNQLQRAVRTIQRSTEGVIRFFNDMRLGRSVETSEAKAVVSELVSTIATNSNAALWLTNLRARDEESAAHCMNTAILALAFARHLGYSHEQMQVIGLGALLHDLGIARLPDRIIKSSEPLSDEDEELIRRHPRDAYNVLKLTRDFPPEALDIILHHHERVDGTGYPDGLAGDEIAEPVRIVAIANRYDSITTPRPYRPALMPPDALAEMHKRAEQDFGRRLMEEFIKCVGIYPVGSVVLLSSGAVGVVASSNPAARLKPQVLLVRDEHGRDVLPRRLLDLAAMSSTGLGQWSISRVVDPGDYGIDIALIAEEELRG